MTRQLVFLCNPPSPPGIVADRELAYGMGGESASGRSAPHSLALCAATLHSQGWPLAVLDAVAERLDGEEAVARVAAEAPAIVVLLASPTTSCADTHFARALRARLPHTRLMLVGTAARFLPPGLVAAADMVLLGEPEGMIHAACERLLEQVPESVFVTAASLGLGERYTDAGQLRALQELPVPHWELFPLARYHALPVVGARGCSHACRYCAAPLLQGALRLRPPQQIVAEMETLFATTGMRRFHLTDPLFGAERAHAQALCAAIVARGLEAHLSWECETRPEQLDLPLLNVMRKAGCRAIFLGVESVTPDTLIAVRRVAAPPDVQQYLMRLREIIKGCRAFGIRCEVHVIAGLPGNPDSAAITRTFLRAYGAAMVHVSPLIPYPGTSIFPTNRREEETHLLGDLPRALAAGATAPAPLVPA